MEKPIPKLQKIYNWDECSEYLKKKYPEVIEDTHYELLDLICERAEVHNDSYVDFWKWHFEYSGHEQEQFISELGELFFKEFSEGKEYITFWVSW